MTLGGLGALVSAQDVSGHPGRLSLQRGPSEQIERCGEREGQSESEDQKERVGHVGKIARPAGEAIVAEAEQWLGVPFKWQGRVKAGCDCKGLIAGVAKACGRPEADSLEALAGSYAHKVPVVELKAGLARLFDRVSERQPGDVLLLKVGGKPQHLAIAAPTKKQPSRTIQALHTGPQRVAAFRVPRDTVDSIWRWRD